MPNTIVLLGGNGRHFEGRADAAIKPGESVSFAADGKYDPQVSAVATALKRGIIVAKEDALQGKTVNDAYAAGDVLFLYTPEPGDHLNLLVKSGQTIVVGDDIVPEGGGSGLWVKAAGTEASFPVQARQASGGALGANTLLECRVN